MCIELWIVIEVNGNIKNIDVFCIVGDGLFEFDQWASVHNKNRDR